MRPLVAGVLGLALLGCASSAAVERAFVTQCGFLRFEAEDWNLFDSEAAFRAREVERCTPVIAANSEVWEQLADRSNSRVCVHGVRTNICGPMEICLYHCKDDGIEVRRISAEAS